MHFANRLTFGRPPASRTAPSAGRSRHSLPGRALAHLIVALGLVMLSVAPGGTTATAQDDGTCVVDGPDSGAYSVRLCLTGVLNGDVLSGDVPVSATFELESGWLPEIEHAQFYFTAADRDQRTTVLRDYEAPYSFTLPTERWADAAYRLEVEVLLADGDFTTQSVGVDVVTANGVSRLPISTGRWKPYVVESTEPVVVAAVGDGASGMASTYDVAELIDGWDPDMLLYLGDVYNVGSYSEFMNYYDPTLGKMKSITNPVPGDHEGGRNFQGYRDYWDSNQHYYTTTAGSWRLIALDSTDRFGELQPGTTQFEWLKAALAEDDNDGCTLVYMHNPRWGLHTNYDYSQLDAIWQLFADEGVDLVLAGHEHNYQRWVPMDGDGMADPDGTTQIVVGTGGHKLIPFMVGDERAQSAFNSFGALRLELGAGGASYEFIDTTSAVLDAGTLTCGDEQATPPAPPPTTAPAVGTIVDTNGLGALCLVAPDETSEVIAVLPDGSVVDVRGPAEGEWLPVRCNERDGYIYGPLISVGDGVPGG